MPPIPSPRRPARPSGLPPARPPANTFRPPIPSVRQCLPLPPAARTAEGDVAFVKAEEGDQPFIGRIVRIQPPDKEGGSWLDVCWFYRPGEHWADGQRCCCSAAHNGSRSTALQRTQGCLAAGSPSMDNERWACGAWSAAAVAATVAACGWRPPSSQAVVRRMLLVTA